MDGGRFEFGTTDLESLSRISGISGSLAGSVDFYGYRHISTLDIPQIENLDTSEVLGRNGGVIFGDGTASIGLNNTSTGEVRTRHGEWTRFGGIGSTNSGEINNFGGLIEFEGNLINDVTGFIGGRGQFITGDGLNNEGVMAFTAGNADVLGDVANISGGQIVTSGLATTTFFDDVVHNGAEIRTAEGSATVFLGELTGAGSFTGSGDVFFEGDLRPGNSPNIVTFEGDVFMGASAITSMELAGLNLGQFDMLEIDGDLHLDGILNVSLLDGFELGLGQEFLIANVGNRLLGEFDGLSEGALVGQFGDHSLYISYSSGDGNDVSLFTAVPEPSAATFLLLSTFAVFSNRRRVRRV